MIDNLHPLSGCSIGKENAPGGWEGHQLPHTTLDHHAFCYWPRFFSNTPAILSSGRQGDMPKMLLHACCLMPKELLRSFSHERTCVAAVLSSPSALRPLACPLGRPHKGNLGINDFMSSTTAAFAASTAGRAKQAQPDFAVSSHLNPERPFLRVTRVIIILHRGPCLCQNILNSLASSRAQAPQNVRITEH